MDFLNQTRFYEILFNVVIVLSLLLLIGNYIRGINSKNNINKTISYAHKHRKKEFLEKVIASSKKLRKLEYDLEDKISICGFEDLKGYDVIKKSFVFSGIGFLLGLFLLNPIASLLFVVIGFAIPIIQINDKVETQLKKMDAQILKAIQLFLNEHQKNPNISEVMEIISYKLDYPIRSEFERLSRMINSGLDLSESLNDFARRMKNEWIYLFVNALIVNKENGSDVTEVLMRTITKISNRQIVRSEKDMETFSGTILNKILMFTVPAAFIAVLIVRPEAKDLFFFTSEGKMVLNIAVVLCISSFVINRLTAKM